MGLRFTSAADYAVRAMIHLACLPEERQVLRDEIAAAENIPSSFMAKILRSLVRGQLLRSARGVNGGFALSRTPDEITLLEIVEAIEGPLNLTDCSTRARPAGRAGVLIDYKVDRPTRTAITARKARHASNVAVMPMAGTPAACSKTRVPPNTTPAGLTQ